MNVLLLGGSTEASALARALAADARVRPVLSLAGRTQHPQPQPVPCRVGGFGGAPGLAAYLREHRVGAMIDATHPFATQMTRNAAEAARLTGVPLLVVVRPAWTQEPGERWTEVPDMAAAALALGPVPRRVLLTVGQLELAAFAATPWHHYVIRSIDQPPAELLPQGAEVITARGPFTEAGESGLLASRGIEVLVTKNSGGDATRPKLAAARALGLPVIMVDRPTLPPAVRPVATVAEALMWLEAQHAATLRGV